MSFFVEGVRNFVMAVDNGLGIERILFSDKLLTNPLARKLVRRCRRSGVPASKLTPEVFRSLSKTRRASGVAAVLTQRWSNLSTISPNKGLCWIAVEKVRSPGNLGTLIRSSNAAGGAGFLFMDRKLDPYSPDVIRATMGAAFRQEFVRTGWPALRQWVRETGCTVIGASPNGGSELHQLCRTESPVLIVLGEERHGLSARQSEICERLVRIPMREGTDSLNLGVAGTLLIYKLLRNRQYQAPAPALGIESQAKSV